MRILTLLGVCCLSTMLSRAEGPLLHTFKKIRLTGEFVAEGAHYGDFDHDGHVDVVAGPYWWAGPDFQVRHEYTAPADQPYNAAAGYSDYFLTYTHDFNADGWLDVLVYSWPGKETAWFENPKNTKRHWDRHVIFPETDNESPTLGDMNGDGKPELIFHSRATLGFAEVDWAQPTREARYVAITKEDRTPRKWFRYTHGYGFGDLTGDSRPEILEKDGWYEQPVHPAPGKPWTFHRYPFAPEGERGGAHMLVTDVNGDGANDVITSWDAHGYGLAWYEQLRRDDLIEFKEHVLMKDTPEASPYGIKFSQLHALALVDMNRDGLMDFVTGKRFWAHGPNKDAEPDAPAVLYWFELRREGNQVDWVPHRIDNDSGVGTQITTGDLNGDGWPDVVSSNKKGVHVFLHQVKKVTPAAWQKAQPKRLR